MRRSWSTRGRWCEVVSESVLRGLPTPFFAIDVPALDENIEGLFAALAEHWPNGIVGYSVKTHSLPWLLRHVGAKGCLAEVVSADEYDWACLCGFSPDRIVYNGPVKGRSQFDECVRAGGMVNLDSARELEWVRELSAEGLPVKVGLRVNFDIDAALPEDIGCASFGTRFGYSVETGALRGALEELRSCEGVSIVGLHMHSTSKSRSPRVYELLARKAAALCDEYGLSPEYIDMGGGFFGGVPGKPSFSEYVETIARELRPSVDPEHTALVLEPGSAIISSPVSFVASVVDAKDTARYRFVVLDGGRPNIDPLHIKTGYCSDVLAGKGRPSLPEQVVAGFTCMETDRLMVLEDAPELAVGDRIAFRRVGSYTMTLNPLFISWFPAVYACDGDRAECVRKRWDSKDWFKVASR